MSTEKEQRRQPAAARSNQERFADEIRGVARDAIIGLLLMVAALWLLKSCISDLTGVA